MKQGFEPGERSVVPEHGATERPAVDGAAPHRVRERFGDRREAGAAGGERLVDLGVGVEYRRAEAREHARRFALAHGDRAGEADPQRASLHSRAARTNRRRLSSTRGSTPNHAAKPGRA